MLSSTQVIFILLSQWGEKASAGAHELLDIIIIIIDFFFDSIIPFFQMCLPWLFLAFRLLICFFVLWLLFFNFFLFFPSMYAAIVISGVTELTRRRDKKKKRSTLIVRSLASTQARANLSAIRLNEKKLKS